MSEPHHHVFNAIQPQINESVTISDVLPQLAQSGILSSAMIEKIKKSPKKAMKLLTSHLRLKDFDAFLAFFRFIAEKNEADYGGKKYMNVLQSIQEVVLDFDSKFGTNHCSKLQEIVDQCQQEYSQQMEDVAATEARVSLEPPTLIKTEEVDIKIAEKIETISLDPSSVTVTEEQSKVLLQPSVYEDIELPALSYVSEPEAITFTRKSLSYYNKKWKLSIAVPASAILDGKAITLKIGACCSGPFGIPDNYLVATDFFCIVGDSEFEDDVVIKMEHCLVLPEYHGNNGIAILKADHNMSNQNGRFSFSSLLKPEIQQKSDSEHEISALVFKMRHFCILCGGVEKTETTQLTPPPSSANTSSEQKTDLKSTISNLSNQVRKRKISTPSPKITRKHRKVVEYVVVFYEPLEKEKRCGSSFNVLAFVCRNCSGSLLECHKQALELLGNPCLGPMKYDICFGSSKQIQFMVPEHDDHDWQVILKSSPQVKEDDINTFTQPLSKSDQLKLCSLVNSRLYPPLALFTVQLRSPKAVVRSLSLKIDIYGVSKRHHDKYLPSFTITAPSMGRQSELDYQSSLSSPATRPLDFHSSLPEMQREVTERECAVVSQNVVNKDRLFKELELPAAVISQIENDYFGNFKEIICQGILCWKKRKKQATVDDLSNALRCAKEFTALDVFINEAFPD